MKIETFSTPAGAFLKFGQQGGGTLLLNVAKIVALVDNGSYTQIEMGNSKYTCTSPILDFVTAIARGQPAVADEAAMIERITSDAGTFLRFVSRGGRRTVLVNIANIIAVEDRLGYTGIATVEETTYFLDVPFEIVLNTVTQ